ncbi:MAG: DUF721 domain-containing protein [Desulfobacteraceae bacterium]
MNHKNSKTDLVHIGSILEKALSEYRPAGDMEMTGIWEHWDEAVGPAVSGNAKPGAFNKGTLIVNVSSSVWMQQLRFLEKDIRSKLNRLLGKELVKSIRFKIAKLHN